MTPLLLNPATAAELKTFRQAPAHALVITGPAGSGKRGVAVNIGSSLIGIDDESFESHAYSRIIAPADGAKSIGIEVVRELEHILSLKVPSTQAINRVIIFDSAHLLSTEAQNALLKTLEEPPPGTVIILSASNIHALLPTIRSRAQHIDIKRPDLAALESYFLEQGFDSAAIKRALAMSGGLIGLTHALLSDSEHPLLQAAVKARELLSQTTFERLAQVDELAQAKTLCLDTIFMMQQMALISLRSASGIAAKRWQRVLKATHEASEELSHSAQGKLVLSNFFLSF